jgi:predicted nucleic acid-binding protein
MGTPDAGLLVLDASVLVELVVAGAHRAGADALLDRYQSVGGLVLVSAAHGLVEATSAIRRMTQRGALAAGEGAQAVAWFGDLNLILDATAPRLRRIWALREQMSAHDAAYAAAAEAFEAPLISTDRRLLGACQAADLAAMHLADLGDA